MSSTEAYAAIRAGFHPAVFIIGLSVAVWALIGVVAWTLLVAWA